MADVPLYYVKGDTVHKRPVRTPKDGGGATISIGFPVCTMTDFVGAEGAQIVADALNAAEAAHRGCFCPHCNPQIEVNSMSKALEDIAAERQRQISSEGWSAEHDDDHNFGDLAAAGGCYAMNAADKMTHQMPRTPSGTPIAWPWDKSWWKPSDKRRDLVKAGALIVAEIERLDRLSANSNPK